MKVRRVPNKTIEGWEDIEIAGKDLDFFNYTDGEFRSIATIHHNTKEVKPDHGYFSPHPYSKYSKKVAKELGYEFNNL